MCINCLQTPTSVRVEVLVLTSRLVGFSLLNYKVSTTHYIVMATCKTNQLAIDPAPVFVDGQFFTGETYNVQIPPDKLEPPVQQPCHKTWFCCSDCNTPYPLDGECSTCNKAKAILPSQMALKNAKEKLKQSELRIGLFAQKIRESSGRERKKLENHMKILNATHGEFGKAVKKMETYPEMARTAFANAKLKFTEPPKKPAVGGNKKKRLVNDAAMSFNKPTEAMKNSTFGKKQGGKATVLCYNCKYILPRWKQNYCCPRCRQPDAGYVACEARNLTHRLQYKHLSKADQVKVTRA